MANIFRVYKDSQVTTDRIRAEAAADSIVTPERVVYVFGTADDVAPNFTTVAGAISYAQSLVPTSAEPVVIRLFTKTDGTPYDLNELDNWGTYVEEYIYIYSDFVRVNTYDFVPVFLPAGLTAWYIDPNGVETLWVGREDGSAWPAVGYKEYVALVTQTGTNAPVATVLSNTLGSGTWSREVAGVYLITFPSSVFVLGNTFPDAGVSIFGQLAENMTYITQARNTQTTYGLNSSIANILEDATTPTDGVLANYAFSIRVYP
jgi:hypothetical protein